MQRHLQGRRQGEQLGQWRRAPEKISLDALHTERLDGHQLARRLDALGNDPGAGLGREAGQGADERMADGVVLQPADQTAVELDDVGAEGEHVAQAGEAGAGVVDRDAQAIRPQRREDTEQRGVVDDLRVLGELDDDAVEALPPAAP